ncbi:MAG: VTT domain-containing protein [Tannerellaceae bacterium]|nr:VTT domain-containing protein [Tannerellaceae bacterium]
MESLIAYGYAGIFVAAFLAATILPFSSEVVLTGVLLAGGDSWTSFAAALAGNSLGGMTCYWLGRCGKTHWIVKYLRMKPATLQKVERWVQNRGLWAAFFVFLPGVGDFIAVALGILRGNACWVAAFMVAGKALRYALWMEFVFRMEALW